MMGYEDDRNYRTIIVPCHESSYKGEDLDERFGAYLHEVTRASYDRLDPVNALASETDGKKPFDTVRTDLERHTIAQLRAMLNEYGLERIPRGPKRVLVELVHEQVCSNIDNFLMPSVLRGHRRFAKLHDIYSQGGVVRIPKDDVVSYDDLDLPQPPALFVFEERDDFLLVIPQEAREALSGLADEDWNAYEECARHCGDFLRHVGVACDFRGILSAEEALELFADDVASIDAEVLETLLAHGPWAEAENMSVVNNNDDVYFFSCDVCEMYEQESDESFDEDAINALIRDQSRLRPHPIDFATDETSVHDYPLLGRLFHSPQGLALLTILDEQTPDHLDERFFSVDVIAALYRRLRGDDTELIIDEILDSYDLMAAGPMADNLYEAAYEASRHLPKWHLNGWSYAELDERYGDDTILAAGSWDDIATIDPSVRHTLNPDGPNHFLMNVMVDEDDEFEDEDWGSLDAYEEESFMDTFMNIFTSSLHAFDDLFESELDDEPDDGPDLEEEDSELDSLW